MTGAVPEQQNVYSLHLQLRQLTWLVSMASATILAISFARLYIVLTYGTDTVIRNLRYFDLDQELAIPAWYSSLLMVACAVLILVISRLAKQDRQPDVFRWTVLSGVFVFMGLDEAVSIHERLIGPLRDGFGLTGIFYFSWVIPGAIMVAAFGIYMLPLLRRLPQRSAITFIAAGTLYLSGALGMEMVGGAIASQQGTEIPLYQLVVTVEETLEFTGLTLFFAALISHLDRTWPVWSLRIEPARVPARHQTDRLAPLPQQGGAG